MKNDGIAHLRHLLYQGVCVTLIIGFQQAALGTTMRRTRYHTVVTNILDDKRIAVDERRLPNGIILNVDIPVVLDGIEIPKGDSQEAKTLQNVLERALIGKRVNILEILETDRSRGGSVYVTDNPKRYAKEDNINLMLVREGVAKWSGECNASDISSGEMEEAQRQAQKAYRGIWGLQPETSLTPPSSPTAIHLPAAAAPQGAVAVPEKAEVPPVADPPAAPPPQTRLVVQLAVGAGVLAALALIVAHFRRRR